MLSRKPFRPVVARRISMLLLLTVLVSLLPRSGEIADARSASASFQEDAATAGEAGQAAGPKNYVYDALGRLKAVTDPASYTGIYNYDAVGNVRSIARQSATQLAILDFSPTSGVVGTAVTIYGTAFSSTPVSNTVKFNGVAATVLSATSTQIVAKVPTGATSGLITVTTGAMTVSSATAFAVGSAAPVISSISPTIVNPGGSILINGSNLDPTLANNTVRLNGLFQTTTAVSSTRATVLLAADATSGHIMLTTPGGQDTSSDIFIPPAPYSTADVAFTGRMTAGASKIVALTTAGKIGLLLFDGSAGQQLTLTTSNSSMDPGYLTVYRPDGTLLIPATWFGTGATFVESITLPANGSYTIQIASSTPSSGRVTISLYSFLDISGTVAPGTAKTVSMTIPGQNARLTFSGLTGQRVSVRVTSATLGNASLFILQPTGESINGMGIGRGSAFMDAVSLPVSGTYTLLVDPAGSETGSVTFTLYSFTDVSGTVTPGSARTVALTTPGQNARLTFNGLAGQRVSLRATNSTLASAAITIAQPNGDVIGSLGIYATVAFMDAVALPVAGTYTLMVNPTDLVTGSLTFTLYSFADVGGSVTPGTARTITTTFPGQNARLTFSGSMGQRVSLRATSSTLTNAYVAVAQPNGDIIGGQILNGGFMDAVALPVTGTYTLVVDPEAIATGSLTFTLYSFADISGTVTAGTPITISTTIPGQNARLGYNGSAGQRISLHLDKTTIASGSLSIIQPGGNVLASADLAMPGAFVDAIVLPVSGAYTILWNPNDQVIGSSTFTLYSLTDLTGALTSGSARTVTLTTPGQNARLTFSGTAGGWVSLYVSSATLANAYLTILLPNGDVLTSVWISGLVASMGRVALPVSGTYTLLLDPADAGTGSVSFTLYSFADVTGTATMGSAKTVALTVPSQIARLTFSALAGQRITLLIQSSSIAGAYLYILQPDSSELQNLWFDAAGGFVDATTLPVAGTYTISIVPEGANTGSVTFTLYSANDVTGTISIGATKTVTMTVPGQNARLTFNGTAGQQVSTLVSTSTVVGGWLSILQPDGTELGNIWFDASGGLLSAVGLPTAGTYTLLVNPYDVYTGTVTLQPGIVTGARAPTTTTKKPPLTPTPQRKTQPAVTATPPNKIQSADSRPSASPTPFGKATASAKGDGGAATTGGEDATGPQPVKSETPRSKNAEASKYIPSTAEEWLPGKSEANGNWNANRPISPWQKLVALRGDAGVTALSGQVLRLDGLPLANVTLRIKDTMVRTDENGQFILTGVAPGHWTLQIDGRSANQPGKIYGVFEAGVDLLKGQTVVLPYIIWMPLLDTTHMIKISSPTSADVVLTNPYIPGLELRIPKGSVIKDVDNKVATEIGITALPLDRTPFPLPTLAQFPVYFTIQPGGAYITPHGAQIIYPNYNGATSGSRARFWFYEPDYTGSPDGWQVYGMGTVAADGRHVTPDATTRIYQTTGASYGFTGGDPSGPGPSSGEGGGDGDPVNLSTGLFIMEKTDLELADSSPLRLMRTYRQNDTVSRPFGVGMMTSYDIFLWGSMGVEDVNLILPDGGRVHYDRTSGVGLTDGVYKSTSTPTEFYNSTVRLINQGWVLTRTDGTVYTFSNTGVLQSIHDRNGNTITIMRNKQALNHGWQTGNISSIISTNGRWIRFTYDQYERVVQAKDNSARAVEYTYGANGRLWKVTDAAAGVTEYTYDDSNRMISIKDARGIVYLTNVYDAAGRVSKQTQADGTTYSFDYTLNSAGKVTQTRVTNPRGFKRVVTFSATGYTLTDTRAYGTALAQRLTYTRLTGSNLSSSVTDALGRKTSYSFDTNGHITQITYLAGTASAVTESFTYEPTYGLPASYTDPLSNTTSFSYDSHGNVTKVTDPLGRVTSITYNATGQPLTVSDPLNNITRFSYNAGILASVADPLGNRSSFFSDVVGRITASIDARGNKSRTSFDALDQAVQTVDALGGVTRFAYDPNGNLLSLTDARGSVTRYTYDQMDRVATLTDPLAQVTTYTYDAAGNIASKTDRKSQLTTYAYDALNRLTGATYADHSTITATFDLGNRLVKIADSSASTIARNYDSLSQLIGEITALGVVSYTYDTAGRTTSMVVQGQPAISYSYDKASQLTGITQGTTNATATYDAAGRVIAATLPNGVSAAYGYDAASRQTGITYTRSGTTLGTLLYSYNSLGQVATISGTLTHVAIPTAVISATYNTANQLTQWGSTTLTYDANGNLTGDGVSTYTWDARNRLTSISGGSMASFNYDAFGRRIGKTINTVATNFLYDGTNTVQELTGSTPKANLLNGADVDSLIARSDAAGTTAPLKDALGSSLALVNSAGSLATTYTYEPFGKTTTSGTASGNSYQYTGRENDGAGLYYYRARYYNPSLQRFISEDPIGFAGGDVNLYSYVGNDPVNWVDPTGLSRKDGDGGGGGCGGGSGAGGGSDSGGSAGGGSDSGGSDGGGSDGGGGDGGGSKDWGKLLKHAKIVAWDAAGFSTLGFGSTYGGWKGSAAAVVAFKKAADAYFQHYDDAIKDFKGGKQDCKK